MSSCFFCFSLCAAHGYHTDSPLLLYCARIPYRLTALCCFIWSRGCNVLLFIDFFHFDKLRKLCRFLLCTMIHAFLTVCDYILPFSYDMRLLSVIFSLYPQTAHLEACDLHSNDPIVIKPQSLKYSIAAASLLLIIQKESLCTIQTFFLNCLLKQPGLSCRSLIMQRDRYFLHPLS